jgi:hypothetical protein
VDAQNAPTGVWKSRREREIPTAPTSIIFFLEKKKRRKEERRANQFKPTVHQIGSDPMLNQAANAAVKTKGSIFEVVYRRLVPRLGHAQAIGAIAHRLCQLV